MTVTNVQKHQERGRRERELLALDVYIFLVSSTELNSNVLKVKINSLSYSFFICMYFSNPFLISCAGLNSGMETFG